MSVAVADVNGDGRPDVATADYYGSTLSVLLNQRAPAASGTFAPHQDIATGAEAVWVATGDINGDGKLDLAVANRIANTVSVMLGNGDGSFQPKQDLTPGSQPQGVTFADVNGDGKPDLLTGNVLVNTVSVFLGNGDGTFKARQDFATGPGPQAVSVVDLNGDGKPDVVVADSGGSAVSVLLGNGNGTFQTHQDFTTDTGPVNVAVVADVNGDGTPDAISANRGGNTVSVLLGTGNGSFQPRADFATGSQPFFVAVADVNGDGRPDVVTANLNGTVSVLLGNGDGTFRAHQDFNAGAYTQGVAITDVNGDGKPDLVTANEHSGTVSVLLGNGDGTFQTHQDSAAGGGTIFVATADLNADGVPDLITANIAGSASVLLGQRSRPATHLQIVGPMAGAAGAPLTITLTALSAINQVDALYPDTVHFTSNDPGAVLPPDYTFVPGDAGSRSFTVILNTLGTRTVTVTDTANGSVNGTSNLITVGGGASITGQVTDGSGVAQAGWQVQLQDGSGNLLTSTTTDTGGNYGFTGLTGGTYKVHEVLPPGWLPTSPQTVPVSLGPTQSAPVNFADFQFARLTNGVLSVKGTPGNDTIAVTLGAGGNGDQATVDGFAYSAPSAASLVAVDGGGGTDTVTLHGTGSGETVALSPHQCSLSGQGYGATVANAFTIAVVVPSGGSDTATLFDSANSDTYTATPGGCSLADAPATYALYAQGFHQVAAVSSHGGTDTASMVDPAGGQSFGGTPQSSFLTDGNVIAYATFFRSVTGVDVTHRDTAYLYDGTGNYSFYATPAYAALVPATAGLGVNYAAGFAKVLAIATHGGRNTASYVDDRAAGTAAAQFGAQAPVPSGPNYRSYLAGPGFVLSAVGFQTTYATDQAGQDTATLLDSAGNDTLYAVGPLAALAESPAFGPYQVVASGFGTVNADSFFGGFDQVAQPKNPAYTLNLAGNWH